MRARMSRRFHHVAFAALLVVMLLPVLPGTVVRAATYTVTSAADSGPGSLRDAIASGADTINFSIGGGAQTIAVQSMLPAIVTPTTINATTQPGYAGAPLIGIQGNAGIVGGIGLKLFAGNTTVIGLDIRGFAGSGIYMSTAGNAVRNCYLIGNTVGINVIGANSNTIGGGGAANRNLISANTNTGILLGSGSTGNRIQGNFIGTDASGTAAVGNPVGVYITGAGGNTIGGTAAGAGNVISGNANTGISILDDAPGSSQNNVIQGNLIGTNVFGTAAIPNAFGVSITNASGNVIGGTAPGARNIISGNTRNGVNIDAGPGNATFNVVQGNFIGPDVNGTGAILLPSGLPQDVGVGISSATNPGTNANNNTIGGAGPAARNIISGNYNGGVAIVSRAGSQATANKVQGNFIGTDVSGTFAVLPVDAGVYIRAASGNTIGGTNPGEGNVISGNNRQGINSTGLAIDGSDDVATENNVVQGNLLGTNAAGTAAIPNGVAIYIAAASNNTIGGTTAAARNVISGNAPGNGVSIDARRTTLPTTLSAATGNVIAGNFIGTNLAGNAALPNNVGVSITDADRNTIGGAAAGAGNVISGNTSSGVVLNILAPSPPTDPTSNTIQGNFIGTDATGNNPLGNGSRGIDLFRHHNTTITGNRIAFNGENGVIINAGNENAILGNPIFSNAGGIVLFAGGNRNQPAPGLTGATYTNGQVRVTGTVFAVGPGGTMVRIDFFSNPTATSQGKVYLGSVFPTSDAGGVVTIDSTINADLSMPYITVTASPAGTNTSPFSPAFAISFPAPAIRSVSPNQGTGAGGTPVTITGINFIPGATVTFGATPATSVTVAADGNSLVANAPPHAGGTVNVTVTNPDGKNATAPNAFTYLGLTPNPQPGGPNNPTAPSPRPPAAPNGPSDPSKPNPLPAVQR